MSKQRTLMIVAICFVLIGTVAAGRGRMSEPKPDSLVSCSGPVPTGSGPLGDFIVTTRTLPPSIESSDECATFEDRSCSPCIRSLEHQGCDVIRVDLLPRPFELFGFPTGYTESVFVLSCARP